MGTGGTIASILGAMLLGGMGKGMFGANDGDGDEATKKLPSDDMSKVRFMKNREVETPSPIDATEMVKKQGLKPTFDNINRMSAGQMKEPAPLDFQPLSNEALMGDPMKQHMMNYNSDDTGPEFNTKNKTVQDMYNEEAQRPKPPQLPKRPANVPGPKSLKEGIEQSKLYEGSEEPGMMEKLIRDVIMPDMSRMPKRSTEKPTSFAEKSRALSEKWYGK